MTSSTNSPRFIAASLVAPLAPIAIVMAWSTYDTFFVGDYAKGYDAYTKGYFVLAEAMPLIYMASVVTAFILARVLFMCRRLSRMSLILVASPMSIVVSVWFGLAVEHQLGALSGWLQGAALFAFINLLSVSGVWVWWHVAHRA